MTYSSFILIPPPPTSTLFPYTTLFRSKTHQRAELQVTGYDLQSAAQQRCCQQILKAVCFRSEEHTSELQSRPHLVCRLLLEKKKDPAAHSRRSAVSRATDARCHFRSV